MSSPEEKYRQVTRCDFDGLVCAVLLTYGGGHENVGTCQVENGKAETVLYELIAVIHADG